MRIAPITYAPRFGGIGKILESWFTPKNTPANNTEGFCQAMEEYMQKGFMMDVHTRQCWPAYAMGCNLEDERVKALCAKMDSYRAAYKEAEKTGIAPKGIPISAREVEVFYEDIFPLMGRKELLRKL